MELEARLPAVLTAINADKMTSYSYDKADTFYACAYCKCYIGKNKCTATAEVFCCEEYEQARNEDGFRLKDGCMLYDRGTSIGKPHKFKTLPKKTMVTDGAEGPDKQDIACIKNAVWR